MLLATQCPECRTIFKVASDQLKLQNGLVRCGVCQHVFNGASHLTELPANAGEKVASTSTPLEAPAKPEIDSSNDRTIASATPNTNTNTNTSPIPSDEFFSSFSEAEIEAEVQKILDADLQTEMTVNKSASQPNEPPSSTPFPELIFSDAEAPVADEIVSGTTNSASNLKPEQDDIQFNLTTSTATIETAPAKPAEQLNESQTEHAPEQTPHNTGEVPDNDINADNIEQLSFIRNANARKRLGRLLTAGTLILVLLLAGQTIYVFRDLIAAAWPASNATLIKLCEFARCQIQLPTQLDALSYEANELHSLLRDKTFEFSLLLRNHSRLKQAWPHIELTLKNTQKPAPTEAILKRVFTPLEYLAGRNEVAAGFGANQEQAVKLYFELSGFKASDYEVTIFYP